MSIFKILFAAGVLLVASQYAFADGSLNAVTTTEQTCSGGVCTSETKKSCSMCCNGGCSCPSEPVPSMTISGSQNMTKNDGTEGTYFPFSGVSAGSIPEITVKSGTTVTIYFQCDYAMLSKDDQGKTGFWQDTSTHAVAEMPTPFYDLSYSDAANDPLTGGDLSTQASFTYNDSTARPDETRRLVCKRPSESIYKVLDVIIKFVKAPTTTTTTTTSSSTTSSSTSTATSPTSKTTSTTTKSSTTNTSTGTGTGTGPGTGTGGGSTGTTTSTTGSTSTTSTTSATSTTNTSTGTSTTTTTGGGGTTTTTAASPACVFSVNPSTGVSTTPFYYKWVTSNIPANATVLYYGGGGIVPVTCNAQGCTMTTPVTYSAGRYNMGGSITINGSQVVTCTTNNSGGTNLFNICVSPTSPACPPSLM